MEHDNAQKSQNKSSDCKHIYAFILSWTFRMYLGVSR